MEHEANEQNTEAANGLTAARTFISKALEALSGEQRTRETSLVITKLEEAELWAAKAQSK